MSEIKQGKSIAGYYVKNISHRAEGIKILKDRWAYMHHTERVEAKAMVRGNIPLGYNVGVSKDPMGLNMTNDNLTSVMNLVIHDKPCRLVLRGASGSGKTRLLLRIIYYLYIFFHYAPVILIDPKSEMNFVRNESSELLPKEIAGIIPSKRFIPSFLNESTDNVSNEYRIGISDFVAQEILKMKYGSKTPPYGVEEVMVRGFYNVKEKHGKKFNIHQLVFEIQDLDGDKVSKRKALNIIREFTTDKRVIFDETNVDVLGLMANGIVPIFQFDMKHELDEHLTSNFVSALIRKITTTIGGVKSASHPLYNLRPLLVIDEARLIAEPQKNTPAKKSLIRAFQVGRGMKISIILASQEFRTIDKGIMSQASHLLSIGKLTTDIKFLISIGVSPENVYDADEICKVDEDTGQRIGCVLNPQASTVDFFSPVLPPMTIKENR